VSKFYAHKISLDVGMYATTISIGAYRSKSLDLYLYNIFMGDSDHGFYVDHFVKDLAMNLKKL
jgi:3-hydroxyisobutyrate dehydrogenase-like beta-hydroxyacid dehydrogenase